MKKNKLSIIKSIYNQSIGYVFDKSKLVSVTIPYKVFSRFKVGYKAQKIFRKSESDLKIFRSTSIETLKSLYYHSNEYIFRSNNWEPETISFTESESFIQLNVPFKVENSLRQLGNDLRIFTTPNIEVLKSLYYKSIGYVFENNSWAVKK
jgi:hypothetical protein